MKKVKYFSLAVLVLSLLAIPAAAQKGKDPDNKGGQDAKNVGDERAAQVHALNQSKKNKKKKKDKDRNPSASTNKTEGMPKAFGHRH